MEQTPQKQVRPYGLWPSPITPAALAQRLRLEEVQWDSDGETLVWLEGRSDRGVLVCQRAGDAPRDLTNEQSVRAGVGYGGGDFTVSQGLVIFVEANGRLYRRGLGFDSPTPITPAFGQAASPVISPDGRWVLYVHSYERKDALALAPTNGAGWPLRLVSGSDFYMQPVWHPAGDRIAWVEWDHPSMPWDGTRLKLARLSSNALSVLDDVTLVAGDPDTPVMQPEFSPDGKWLSYISGEGEWDRLYLMNLETGEKRLLVQGGALSTPPWVQGIRVYGWSPSSERLFYLWNEAGFESMWQVEVGNGSSKQVDMEGYTSFRQVAVSPKGDQIACLASSPLVPDRVVVWQGGSTRTIKRSDPENYTPEDLSTPRPIEWVSSDGMKVYGLFYPPANRLYTGQGLPPAVVYIHGGPTGQVTAGYSADSAFFTSRGYGYLAVNYRGSTGYGRAYMLALRERWGILDVEDAVSGAQELINQGLADIDRLVIKGGSAGGYTVLNSLIRYPRRFKAGLCSYGVSNLFTLAMDTHKFEEHYLDSMVGLLPQSTERYQAWSPIYHTEHIRSALAVFQGTDDRVVPPDQAETIVASLRKGNVPHIYRLYEGEGHGWRKVETVAAFYRDIDLFLRQYVLFSA